MNRSELITAYAQATSQTKVAAKAQLEALQTVVFDEMKAEGEVALFEGVKLMGVHKDATTARNPMDGSTVDVPEKTVPKAKFGTVCKRIVNGEE